MRSTELKEKVQQDEQIVDIPIFGKNGEPYLAKDGTQATIGVVGSESQDYRRAENQISRRNLRRGRPTTPADLRENRLDQHVACVKRWHGWEDDNDTEIPCTPDNVKELLGSAEHVLDQVVAGIVGHASFFGKPSEN